MPGGCSCRYCFLCHHQHHPHCPLTPPTFRLQPLLHCHRNGDFTFPRDNFLLSSLLLCCPHAQADRASRADLQYSCTKLQEHEATYARTSNNLEIFSCQWPTSCSLFVFIIHENPTKRSLFSSASLLVHCNLIHCRSSKSKSSHWLLQCCCPPSRYMGLCCISFKLFEMLAHISNPELLPRQIVATSTASLQALPTAGACSMLNDTGSRY